VSESSSSNKAESFQVTLQHVSAGFFLDILRHVHPGIAADTTASGEVNGDARCEWRGFDTLHACSGELHSTPLTLRLPHVERPLRFSPLLISAHDAANGPVRTGATRVSVKKGHRDDQVTVKESLPGAWILAPTHVSMSATSAAALAGALTPSGLTLHIDGPADLRDLNQLARAMNSPVLSGGIHSIIGAAQMALTLRSNWLPQSNPAVLMEGAPSNASNLPAQPVSWFVPSQWEGTVQIHNATLQLGSFPGTIQIAAAQVNLTDTGVEWSGLTGTYARIPFDGSIRWETSCPTSRPPCARTFTLHTANLNVDRLQGVLRRTIAESGLLEQLNPWATGAPELPEISGTFKADTLSAGKFSLKNASLQLHLQGHQADLVAISGSLFGGTVSGLAVAAVDKVSSVNVGSGSSNSSNQTGTTEPAIGSAQWGNGAPTYTMRVTLENIQPNLVAAMWHEKWGRGTATAQIRVKTRGWSTADLAQNASGKFAIDWRSGTLAALLPLAASATETADSAGESVATQGVTRFQRLRAAGHFSNEKLTLDIGQLVLANPTPRRQAASLDTQSMTGTVSFARVLDLRLQPSGVSITGPLDMPVMKARFVRTVGSPRAANSENP
jgi:hypothetical protein